MWGVLKVPQEPHVNIVSLRQKWAWSDRLEDQRVKAQQTTLHHVIYSRREKEPFPNTFVFKIKVYLNPTLETQ